MKNTFRCGFAALAVAGATHAFSADEDASRSQPGALAEIVVTAQKRSESIQDVPIAITAVSGDQLRDQQISDLQSLAAIVPNVNFGNNLGSARISIRGLGLTAIYPAAEPRVAYNLDGVYVSRPSAVLGTFFDVDRVEVLEGPQGTLYGRNAVAGAVNMVTRDPSKQWEGFAELTGGNYSLTKMEAAVGGPLADTVSFRVAVQSIDHSGYGENFSDNASNAFLASDIDDQHTRAIRGKLKYEPTDAVTVLVSADYFREHDAAGAQHYFNNINAGQDPVGATLLGGKFVSHLSRDVMEDTLPNNFAEIYGMAGTATWDLNRTFSLISITGYRHSSTNYDSDTDLTTAQAVPEHWNEKSRQVTEEMRVQAKGDWGTWVLGGYFFDERIDSTIVAQVNGALYGLPDILYEGADLGGVLQSKSYAGFTQLDYNITRTLSVTLGGRYSKDRKHTDGHLQYDLSRPYNPANPLILLGTQNESISEGNFSPRAGLQYKVTPSILLYATYAKGYRAGGWDQGQLNPPYRSEKLTDYEGGIKADWLEEKLRTNLSGFYYKFKDMQVSKTNDVPNNPGVITENAAAAKLYGVEAQIILQPTPELQFDFTGGWLHSAYENFITLDPARQGLGPIPPLGEYDASGNELEQAPKFTLNLGAQYRYATGLGDFTLRGEAYSQARVYYSPFQLQQVSQAGYSLFNLYLNYESTGSNPLLRGLYGSLFMRNIGDKLAAESAWAGSNTVGNPFSGTLIPPRTYGLRVGYRF